MYHIWACRKLRRRSHDGLCRPKISHFVSRRETETDRQQPVLLTHRPGAGETEAFPQPQHGLEPPDRSSRRVEGLKAGLSQISGVDGASGMAVDFTLRRRGATDWSRNCAWRAS